MTRRRQTGLQTTDPLGMTEKSTKPPCAWVTGASSGLGRAVAERLAREGWWVAVSARRVSEIEELAQTAQSEGHRMLAVPADVTDDASIRRAVETIEAEIGPIDLAILNAGSHTPMSAGDFSASGFQALVETNLVGTARCLDSLLPGMIERRRGHLAIVASVAGYVGLPTAAAYGATKAGLINLAEALKPDLEAHGIKIQLVNPGFVRTPLTDKNPFRMPLLMEVGDAADALLRGLQSARFEISFPWRFTVFLKLLRLLPYGLVFAITRPLLPNNDR
jgi:NAD(P)-dependent dehydrogenase (short-subunit alcohol dehydrogenase family)